jgi:hypothetical protein
MSRPPLLPAPFLSVPRESAVVRLTQRVNAYQPRVQPWESNGGHARAAWDGEYGRTVPARVGDATTRAGRGPTMRAVVRLTQKVNAYQPRVQPWEMDDRAVS